jgi:glycosyltransferase involved in cell wall biosynthesis
MSTLRFIGASHDEMRSKNSHLTQEGRQRPAKCGGAKNVMRKFSESPTNPTPMVSICVPNLNTRPYLPERFATIFNQTLEDWELIVCDGYSDDGAWEYIEEMAANEPRMRISQSPRQGVYAAFNECVGKAQGKYVYIATSDDTMTPDCLARMVEVLERNEACGIAHCCLDFINEDGAKLHTGHCWQNWYTTRFFGNRMDQCHLRPCGHDTVVALGLKTVYYSMTQLLTRRSVFAKVGLFETKWGSFGDLEWQMRAALATATVHVPEYLATWRVHSEQASQLEWHYEAVQNGWFLDMAYSVIRFSRANNLPQVGGLPQRLIRFYWTEFMNAQLAAKRTFPRKCVVLMNALLSEPLFVVAFVQQRVCTRLRLKMRDICDEVRHELMRMGLETVPCETNEMRPRKEEVRA